MAPILVSISSPNATPLNQSVAIFCQATGFPVPTITWQKNGTGVVVTNTSRFVVFSFAPLLVPVSNETSDFESSDFVGGISELIRANGLDVSTFTSLDELRVVGVLYFESVVRGDTGSYTCTASNVFPVTMTLRSMSDAVPLVVLGKPVEDLNYHPLVHL